MAPNLLLPPEENRQAAAEASTRDFTTFEQTVLEIQWERALAAADCNKARLNEEGDEAREDAGQQHEGSGRDRASTASASEMDPTKMEADLARVFREKAALEGRLAQAEHALAVSNQTRRYGLACGSTVAVFCGRGSMSPVQEGLAVGAAPRWRALGAGGDTMKRGRKRMRRRRQRASDSCSSHARISHVPPLRVPRA